MRPEYFALLGNSCTQMMLYERHLLPWFLLIFGGSIFSCFYHISNNALTMHNNAQCITIALTLLKWALTSMLV